MTPANRLERLGHRSTVSRKPPGGPPALTRRHLKLIDYMVNGCPDRDILAHIKRAVTTIEDGVQVTRMVSPEPGTPLELIEAADLLHIRRRNARSLSALPLFQKHLAKAVDDLRLGHTAEAMRTVIDVMRDPGFGKAADRKVQLEAADRILQRDSGTNISLQITNNVQMTAGVVIRLPASAPATALDAVKTIEHEPTKKLTPNSSDT